MANLWREKSGSGDDLTDYPATTSSPSADTVTLGAGEGAIHWRATLRTSGDALVAPGSMTFNAQLIEVATSHDGVQSSRYVGGVIACVPNKDYVADDAKAGGSSRTYYLRITDIANAPGTYDRMVIEYDKVK